MFSSEIEFENRIRKLIVEEICAKDSSMQLLQNKDVVDILVCKNANPPILFFIEAKFHKTSNRRIAFGNGQGGGFQPEILLKRPKYFDNYMRWVFGKENDSTFYILSNDEACQHLCGGQIGTKFNNFQPALFRKTKSYTEQELLEYLINWFNLRHTLK